MRYFRILSTLALVFMFACGQSRQQQALEQLNEILILKESGNYNLARLKIDSLLVTFYDQEEQVHKAKELMKEITILEQSRSLVFLDSMIVEKELQLEPMLKNFMVSDEYGPEKILIHHRQKPENTYYRTFLRAHLNEIGRAHV